MADLVLADWLDGERDRIVETLLAWLRIPSISAHADRASDVRRSAEFAAAVMTGAGLEHVALVETDGLPAVYGDWRHAGADAPTVLVYGHHDVQPVEPLDEWRSPPFEPVIVDGECLARGAIDDKGQVLYEIEAVRGLLAETGGLPVNLKFLVEGEEEIGSPNFEALLAAERARLAADVIVVSDTGMWAADVPSICVGMRGLVAFDVTLRTAAGDLHSGVFGGAVPNPAHLVASIVARLHDESGRVTVPGFYDDVRPLDAAEADSLARLAFDEAAWRANAGVARTEGEAGYSVLERTTVRPTCDVVGIGVGYTGPGIKTIVPATGGFKVTFRLVPDQRPPAVADAFESWLRSRVPDGVEVEIEPEGPGVAPLVTDVTEPAIGALAAAIERVWGTTPLFTREGGSGPEESLGRMLAAPVLFLGVGLPGDRIHAPNERMVMDQFWKGLLAAAELWRELGDLGRSGLRGG
ncbi:MAG: acetylornithine deacetylase/succinyldiaminopimelate desuccinylase-like deacylase [Acidimicrobiales bacterium]|jgi:acetylornithine deacetylase/succinyl-diaminopimelate desuccinylase-like protein|nr:acetylornithine deacetylase/succinyldiaminopimelate desuccinylase-like deacylase [Acidimicrobiales bacterium]